VRADIRIRIRRLVIRIRVTEPCMRAIIRITARKNAPLQRTTQYFKIPSLVDFR